MYLPLISLLTVFLSGPQIDVEKQKNVSPQFKNAIGASPQDCVDSRLRAGICIPLAKCPDVVEEFYDEARKTSYGIDFQSYINNSICGFDGMNFLICCAKLTIDPITTLKPPILIETTYVTTQQSYEQLSQATGFYFSSLTSNTTPIQTANVDVTTNTSDMGVIVLKPTVQPTTNGDAQVIKAMPELTSTTGNLITQTGQGPLAIRPRKGLCGVSKGTTNRVVGGNEAKRGNYPWMAALGYRDEYNANTVKYLCGGSLISNRYVLTSAHCINGNLILVRLGAHDLSNAAELNARNYRIKRTITHDMFDLKSITNDLALIELSEAVVMTDYISPICLPDEQKFLTQEFTGMNPFVAGWGATNHQGPTSSVLREVQVPIINRQVCEQSYRSVFNFVKLSDKLICAGNSNVDACQGDSGGPLMLPQMSGSTYHYYLLGVVSFGYECARTGFPGVYSRVAAYMPWIKSNMI